MSAIICNLRPLPELLDATLERASLQGTGLRRARLEAANLERARMQGADFSEAQMPGVSLVLAEAQGASFALARMQAADLRYAGLQGASLYSADLSGARLLGTALHGAQISRVAMQGAVVARIELWRADVEDGPRTVQGAMIWPPSLDDKPPSCSTSAVVKPTGCPQQQSWEGWIAGWMDSIPTAARNPDAWYPRSRRDEAWQRLKVILGKKDVPYDRPYDPDGAARLLVRALEGQRNPDAAQFIRQLAGIACSSQATARGILRQIGDPASNPLLEMALPQQVAARMMEPGCAGTRLLTEAERQTLTEIAARGR